MAVQNVRAFLGKTLYLIRFPLMTPADIGDAHKVFGSYCVSERISFNENPKTLYFAFSQTGRYFVC